MLYSKGYEEFDVTTKCKYGTLLMTMAQNNIKEGTDRGNPILARVTYNGIKEGHFVVVCGFSHRPEPSTSYVTIMDPLSHAYRIIATKPDSGDSIVQYTDIYNVNTYNIDMYLTIV